MPIRVDGIAPTIRTSEDAEFEVVLQGSGFTAQREDGTGGDKVVIVCVRQSRVEVLDGVVSALRRYGCTAKMRRIGNLPRTVAVLGDGDLVEINVTVTPENGDGDSSNEAGIIEP